MDVELDLDRVIRAVRATRVDGVGIDRWLLFASSSRSLSLGVKDRQVGNAHAPINISESCGLSYKLVWEDGQVSRGSIERHTAGSDPESALRESRVGAHDDPDGSEVLGPAPFPDVETHDGGTARLAAGEVEPLGDRLAAIRSRVDAADVETWSASLSAGEGCSRLLTSAGLDGRGRGTSTGWHVSIDGQIGDGRVGRAIEAGEEFDARLDRVLTLAALLRNDAPPPAAGVMPVILHPDVVEAYVLDTLLHNLGGSTVSHGDGQFRREDFGSDRAVLREDLTLRHDPLLPWRRGSYRFTGEGLPAAPVTYIERGRLNEPIANVKYARRLERRPTCGPASTDTLFLEGPPELDERQGRLAARGGALVLSVLGVHTQDSSSGDFSLSAPQVLTIGDDGYVGRIRATISGNLFELLRSDSLRLVRFPGEHTPGLLVQCRLDPGQSG